MKRLSNFLMLLVCLLLLTQTAQAQLPDEIKFTGGVIDSTAIKIAEYVAARPYLWESLYKEGLLGKTMTGNYYVIIPVEEQWSDGVVCYEVRDSTLFWCGGRKILGWKGEFAVEPVKLKHQKIIFQVKDKKIKKEKPVETISGGNSDLADIVYKGIKGVTIRMKNRKKPKELGEPQGTIIKKVTTK